MEGGEARPQFSVLRPKEVVFARCLGSGWTPEDAYARAGFPRSGDPDAVAAAIQELAGNALILAYAAQWRAYVQAQSVIGEVTPKSASQTLFQLMIDPTVPDAVRLEAIRVAEPYARGLVTRARTFKVLVDESQPPEVRLVRLIELVTQAVADRKIDPTYAGLIIDMAKSGLEPALSARLVAAATPELAAAAAEKMVTRTLETAMDPAAHAPAEPAKPNPARPKWLKDATKPPKPNGKDHP